MDPATILVLALCAGAVALFVWFEINSRRNEASNKQASSAAQPGLVSKDGTSKARSETDETKAA